MIGLVWYLTRVFLLTLLARGALALFAQFVGRQWPETVGALAEVAKYGWWISLVVGALLAAAWY